MSARLAEWERSAHLYAGNAPYLEEFYARWLTAPESLPAHWRVFFEGMQQGRPLTLSPHAAGAAPTSAGKTLPAEPHSGSAAPVAPLAPAAAGKQAAVLRLINAYRVRGHQQAQTDPLCLASAPAVPDLDPAFYGLTAADVDLEFDTGSLATLKRAPLRAILALLQRVYTGPIGAEYMHITDTARKRWLQRALEDQGMPVPTADERRRLLARLVAAEGLERYLHTRYVGQKRFSLEGAEALVPALDELIRKAGLHGLKEIVIGMAHRGRLNVLVNTLGKQPCDLFQEFEGTAAAVTAGSGDVKYHLGFSADAQTPGGPVHLTLSFNPSHLEIIGPVVAGSVRARQHRRRDLAGVQVLPVLIHGDAAFAGQGVVMENFNMSQARGFTVGGTVHIVINNQIGFTTSNTQDSRSTAYCTDVAKMVQAPILHVNGDDPEAVVFVIGLALDFRMAFGMDVVVDLVCYRRHGHNEADEPAVTQPVMYQKIRAHPTPVQVYAERLRALDLIDAEAAETLRRDYVDELDQCRIVAPQAIEGSRYAWGVDWQPYLGTEWTAAADTAIALPDLQSLAGRLLALPPDFEPHPRAAHVLADRHKMAAGVLPVDWGCAETLAYGSLLAAGHQVRLSGQDSGRGTFFHRHAVLHDQRSGASYVPLRHLATADGPECGDFAIVDSLLSEAAVLAFEYGYATAEPRGLIVWEAQFGDFANGAQVVIDQFISSGQAKWNRLCGLTLLLPHGYEGQGPEHSSARIERWLQLCAEHNLQICMPSTAAQMFHLLRQQVLRPYRRPLIVFTPKSLLRHKAAASPLAAFTTGGFEPVLTDPEPPAPDAVHRVLLVAGKLYYELAEARRQRGETGTAILRLEQFYPFPEQHLRAALAPYAGAARLVWCQEEPQNQGAWYQIRHRLQSVLQPGQSLAYAGRPCAATPAVGQYRLHLTQQQRVVEAAFASDR